MKIERDFILHGERYDFDFGDCSPSNGYAQVDTCQDASYYGTWTNPFDLTIVNYAEGDVTTQVSDSVEEYVDAINQLKAWYTKMNMKLHGIDTMLDDKLNERFIEIGLGDYLH